MIFAIPGKMRRLLSPLPVIATERLVMRPITEADCADMYEYSRDPATSAYLLWEPHPDPAYTLSHIRQLLRQYRSLTFFDWALVEKTSGKMIGTAGFTHIYGKQRKAEIGYVLSPAFHRRGLAPEAVQAVLDFGFHKLGLKSAVCRIMEGNEGSVKVAERLGFHYLGCEKGRIRKHGVIRRVMQFEISAEEYENCRDR